MSKDFAEPLSEKAGVPGEKLGRVFAETQRE
jgi:hypothetical protein